jgi:uncharacterized protein (DUF2062 family)
MTDDLNGIQSPPPTIPKRGFWQRRVRDPLIAQLTQGVTVHKLALTIALGVACGLFPFLGLTSLLCFVVAIVLKLNQPIIQIVNQLLWPAHLTAIVFYVWLGNTLFDLPPIPFDHEEIKHLLLHTPGEFFHRFGLLGLCALVVWLVSVPFIVACVYYSVRPVLRRFATLRQARASKN